MNCFGFFATDQTVQTSFCPSYKCDQHDAAFYLTGVANPPFDLNFDLPL